MVVPGHCRSFTVNPLYNDIRYNSKFVITSIWSAQKSADRVYFHLYSHIIPQEDMRFMYLLDRLVEAILTNTQNV